MPMERADKPDALEADAAFVRISAIVDALGCAQARG